MSNISTATFFSAALCFAQTALAQPAVTAVVNGASFQPAVGRGCIVSIFGSQLADSTASAGGLPVARKLANTTVTFGDLEIEAPLSFVSSGQINAQIPFEVLGSSVPMWVTTAAGKSKPFFVSLADSGPGLFTKSFDGKGPVLAFGPNFQPLDRAAPGSTLILYAAGLGATDPPLVTGSPGAAVEPLNRVVNLPEVLVGEFPARVDFAGLAPGLSGVYQLNVVPQLIGSDRIMIRSGGATSNIASIATTPGQNVSNASGAIQAIYPLADPASPPAMYSPLLFVVKFTAHMDILPSAGPFMIAAVSEAGTSLVAVDPAAGTYTGTVTVPTVAARFGDFSGSGIMPVDFATCSAGGVNCLPFPGGIIPFSRMSPFELNALTSVPLPNSPSGVFQIHGTARAGSTFVIDGQNNSSLAAFAGYLAIPPPANLSGSTGTTTLKLFIDGRLVASSDVTYRVGAFLP